MKLQTYISVISGEVFEVMEDEKKNMKEYHIPLKKRPPHNCKKCYGRGYTGKNLINNAFVLCTCVQKLIDFEQFDKEEITLEVPKTTNEIDLSTLPPIEEQK